MFTSHNLTGICKNSYLSYYYRYRFQTKTLQNCLWTIQLNLWTIQWRCLISFSLNVDIGIYIFVSFGKIRFLRDSFFFKSRFLFGSLITVEISFKKMDTNVDVKWTHNMYQLILIIYQILSIPSKNVNFKQLRFKNG